MALPVILVDSATGSDTTASGAGPSTALNGTTNASTSGTGLVVTLPAGTILTGVSITGSDVIFLNDTTAGNRNFGKITATAGSGGATPTVTVSDAFGLTLSSKSWAIGGKRASIGSTTSSKLFVNNSANGDAMPGWIIEMQSGHAETLSGRLQIYRSGDTTNGLIILQGTSGAATLPILTWSNDGHALKGESVTKWAFKNFEMRNSNASKTASYAWVFFNDAYLIFENLVINNSSNKFWRLCQDDAGNGLSGQGITIRNCNLGNFTDRGLWIGGNNSGAALIDSCVIFSSGEVGIYVTSSGDSPVLITNCLIYNHASDGIRIPSGNGTIMVRNCTINGNSGDGIDINNSSSNYLMCAIVNTILSNNGAYGITFGAATSQELFANLVIVDYNDFYNNTSGICNPSAISTNGLTLNPQYTNSAAGDFSIGTNLKAMGYPPNNKIGINGLTSTYIDTGAAQRQETGSSGGGLRPAGIGGLAG